MIAQAPTNNGTQFKSVVELLVEQVSASRLKRWSTCRLQFFYHYVQKITKPSSPALVVGRVVHSVLQEFNRARWKGDYTFKENLNEVFEAKWTEEQEGQEIEWKDDQEKQKLTALGLVELYLDQTPIKRNEKPMAVEVRLEADLSKYGLPKLIGVIDLVRPKGVIVDFKTSAQSPNPDNVAHLNEIQLSTYSVLFRKNTGDKESGQELHYLVKTKTPKLVVTSLPPMTDNQQSRLFHQIESYVRGIEQEDYIPTPGMACLSCQFINECRHWH